MSIGFALGMLLSLGTVTSASVAATNVAAPLQFPAAGIEVIVVTAKRPAAQPVDAAEPINAQPIDEFIVTAKRVTKAKTDRTPPAMAIAMPKLELAVGAPPPVRF